MAILSNAALGVITEIAALLRGAVASGMKLINNLLSNGLTMMFKFDQEAMAFSRQVGLSAKQAQAYSEVLITRAKTLGEKYGIAAEEVTKLEKNLAKATGRVIMLNNAQADMQIALNRTVGEQTADEFSKTMMRSMGAQFEIVQGAVSKAYAVAARRGLDAAGMAAKVGQNLTMANRLTFRNGVDGLTRMVALSEKLGFNLSSMESAANKFMDLQDSIENAAKLSMLGGPMGALGGNPLDMTYEANYSMEDFTERVTKMVAGLAHFDEKTGMAKSSGLARDFARQLANTLGYSMDEIMSMANKQAEIRYKESRFGVDINRLAGGDENKRDFILNKAQYDKDANNGKGGLVMTDRSGKKQDISYFTNTKRGRDELDEMMRFNKMTDEQIIREQAEAVVSIKERLEGYLTTIGALIGEKIMPYADQIRKFLGDIYKTMMPHFGKIADNIKKLVGSLFAPENIGTVKSTLTGILKAITWFGKLFTSNWKWLIGGALISPILASLAWIANLILTIRRNNALGAGVPGAGGPGAGAGGARGGLGFGGTLARYNQATATFASRGKGALASRWLGASSAWKAASPMTRFGMVGAPAAGIGLLGMGLKSMADEEGIKTGNKADTRLSNWGNALEDAGIGMAIGGAIGSIIPGLGTAIGAAVGGALAGGAWGYWRQSVENDEKRLAYEQERDKRLEELMRAPATNNNTVTLDGPHDLGLMTPPAGAKSMISDYLASVANGKKILSLTEPGESFITADQRKAINESIEAMPVGNVTHFVASNNGAGDSKISFGEFNPKLTIEFKPLKVEGDNFNNEFDVSSIFKNDRIAREFINQLFSRPEIAQKINDTIGTNIYGKPMRDTGGLIGAGSSKGGVGRMMNGKYPS